VSAASGRIRAIHTHWFEEHVVLDLGLKLASPFLPPFPRLSHEEPIPLAQLNRTDLPLVPLHIPLKL
jgi:hypothetical protein